MVVVSGGGCGSILGFDAVDDLQRRACIHNSDCPDGLDCLNFVCAPECEETIDCTGPSFRVGLACNADHKCVEADAGPAASPDGEASCGDTSTDVNNCGWCGHVCGTNQQNHEIAMCAYSKCRCAPGWDDCNHDSSDGCEADLSTDSSNCSYCGRLCESTVCQGGNCLQRSHVGYYVLPSLLADNYPINSFATEGGGEAEVFGFGFQIDTASVLLKLGIVTSYGGPTGYLALYDDALGTPTTRLARTDLVQLLGDPHKDNAPQATEANVIDHPDLQLAPGAYWILAVFDSTVWVQTADRPDSVACGADVPNCSKWYFNPQPFGVPPQSANVVPVPSYVATPVMYAVVAQ
jgi:hypothetical protein